MRMVLHALRRAARHALSAHPTALGWARRAYRAAGAGKTMSEDDYLFDLQQARGGDIFFLQVGANDGIEGDPIRRYVSHYGWRGLLLEPVPHLYQRLCVTYRHAPGLILENAALAEQDGPATFYRLRSDLALPPWAEGLGSFRRDVVLSHRDSIPDIERHLVEETVRCVTFNTLMAKHGIDRLDLIVIDTEGYDLAVLRQLDLRRFSSELILYEQLHLPAADRSAATALLEAQGYEVRPILNTNVAALRKPL